MRGAPSDPAGLLGPGRQTVEYGRFATRLCLLLLLVGVPALGLTIYGSFRERQGEKTRLREGSLAIASLAAANQESFIRNTRQLFATLGQFPFLLLSTNRAFSANHLSNLRKLLPDYANFGLIETNGRLFCSAEPFTNEVYLGDRTYFQRAMATREFSIGDFQIGRLTGARVLNLGFPVLDANGGVARILFASLKVSRVREAIKDLPLPEAETLTVMDEGGTILARQPSAQEWVGRPHPDATALRSSLSHGAGFFEKRGTDGVTRLYAVTSVGQSHVPAMLICVEMPMNILFAPANKALYGHLLALLLIALGLCVVVQLYARRSFLVPVQALSTAAERLANGDLGARAGAIGGAAELVQLGRVLDEMAEKVQARAAELLHSNEALRAQIAERERAEEEARRHGEEKRQLQDQVLRSQRMESLGALAGGIAHDLNNALVPVLMGSELLREHAGTSSEQRQFLDLIASSGQRCTAMVKQILTFAKGSRGLSARVPVSHLVKEMAALAQGTFPKSIQVVNRYASDLWEVCGNATELHQVLLNLCVNARDAMAQAGCLRLTAQNVDVAESLCSQHPEATPGPYVLVTVADTGCGIPPELQSRIFEPFFTTKAADKGTGLGLSTVVSIVKRHNGFIQVHSAPGRGTEFQVYLPAAPATETEPTQPGGGPLPSGHGEMVLLADDEGAVRELSKSTLETYGYRVVTASNGLEAVACFELHAQEVKLVVMDTDMPYLDGIGALRRIREIAPQVPLVMASASSHDTEIIARQDLSGVISLRKPYGVEELVREAANALASA